MNMHFRNPRKRGPQGWMIAFGLGVTVLVSACASVLPYRAPSLPRNQAATLQSGYVVNGYNKARLTAIDGREVLGAEGSIILSPGAHRPKLFVSAAGTTIVFGEAEVTFEAQPDRVYQIHGEIRYGTARVWVVDERTNRVAGRGSQRIAHTGGP